jgi:two-component system, OmpR family, sensor kinase
MGRLFWKIFLVILLAQLATINIVGTLLWVSHSSGLHWLALGSGVHQPRLPLPRLAVESTMGPGTPADGFPRGERQGPPPALSDSFPPVQRGIGPPPFDGPRDFPWMPVIVGSFASSLFAAFLARYLSRPIMALRKAFRSVAEGNFDIHPVADIGRRRDELAELGHDFEHTARQLKGLIGNQRRLLHDVSHEVRSPLARMQLAIDLGRQQPEKIEMSMQRIERESGRIDRLVGELLTLSRLEAGACDRFDEEIDVLALVTEVVEDARFEATPINRAVELNAEGEVLVRGNIELFQRAIENVVRNAVRHTFEKTLVKVSLFVEGSNLRICVDDDGPGLPDNALDAIFEPFVRFSGDRSNDGYGLGLAITRYVVEAHAGKVRAINRPYGGLRVEMTFPVSAPLPLHEA